MRPGQVHQAVHTCLHSCSALSQFFSFSGLYRYLKSLDERKSIENIVTVILLTAKIKHTIVLLNDIHGKEL